MESIGSPFFGFEEVLNLLMFLPYLGALIFALYIAVYFKKRNKGKEANMLVLGAILQAFSYLASHLMNFFIVSMIADDYTYIQIYYGFIRLIGSVGHLLFLYGVYLYFKKTFNQKHDHQPSRENDLNSFIGKL